MVLRGGGACRGIETLIGFKSTEKKLLDAKQAEKTVKGQHLLNLRARLHACKKRLVRARVEGVRRAAISQQRQGIRDRASGSEDAVQPLLSPPPLSGSQSH